MSELRLHVDALEASLRSSDLMPSETLTRAAAAYLEACRQVNERLAQCDEQLRRGLRSEAIRLAQMEPDLLEMYGILNFAERDNWDERAMLLNWEIPPRLNHRVAQLLDRAYLEEQSLGDLLQSFRHQALSRAPLARRLETLRLIAQAESGNPAWQQDIETFEAARLNEMRDEAKSLQRETNWPLAQELMDEAQPGRWKTPIPLDLSQDVTREYKRQGRIDAQTQIARTQKQLSEAAASIDVEACKRIRDNIYKLCDERGIGRTDAILEALRPQFEWLADQEKRQQQRRLFGAAVDDLRAAMQQDAPTEVVKQLYEKTRNFRFELPADVEGSYHRFIRRDSNKRIVEILLIIGLITAVVAIIGGFLIWIFVIK